MPSIRAEDAPAKWVGKRVITKFAASLRVADQVVDTQTLEPRAGGGKRTRFRVYRVEQVRGPWLWLVAEGEGIRGWVDAKEVVPFDGAIDYYTTALRSRPNDPFAYIARGNVWRRLGKLAAAIADYDRAIALDPGDEIAWVDRGNAWMASGDLARAIADYDRAIALDPSYSLAFNNRGFAHFRKADHDRAIADYTEAIRLDPKDARFYLNRGYVDFLKKDDARALADYNEAIRIDPGHPAAYFERAIARAMRDREGASADLKTAVKLEHGEGSVSIEAALLGDLLARELGDEASARQFLADAAKCDATRWPYPVVQYLRGELDGPALLDRARDVNQRTEARGILGLDEAIKGHNAEAAAHFRWIKERGNPIRPESRIASDRLERMGEAR